MQVIYSYVQIAQLIGGSGGGGVEEEEVRSIQQNRGGGKEGLVRVGLEKGWLALSEGRVSLSRKHPHSIQ